MTESGWTEQFRAGTLSDGWRWFGAHRAQKDGQGGWIFRVWAPHAQGVSVVGDFNGWSLTENAMLFTW